MYYFSILFFIFISIPLYAQTSDWAKQIGGIDDDASHGVVTDAQNNVYLAGGFSGNLFLGSYFLTAAGGKDMLIAKFSSDGELIWAIGNGGAQDDELLGIAYHNNAIYVTGYFAETVTFTGTSGLNISMTANSISAKSTDAVVLKFNTDGVLQWARQMGGSGFDDAYAISVDSGGNVGVTGSYRGAATFGTSTLDAYGATDAFIAKLSNSGAFLWAKRIGGIDLDYGNALSFTSFGDICVAGEFSQIATFETGNTLSALDLSGDAFVAKYNSSGNLIWTKRIGSSSGYETALAVKGDHTGACFVTGMFNGTIDLGNNQVLNAVGTSDIFVAKFNNNGIAEWKVVAGNGLTVDTGTGLFVDVQGNTFLTGRFGGTIVLGATNLISTGSGDAFWAKINATGTVEWARKAGGTSEDRATSIVKNAKGQIFIAGDFEGVTYFPTATTAPSLFANGSSDIFLVRVHENGLVPNDGAESPQAFSLQAFPNPFTNQLTLKLSQNAIVEILNLQGQTLHQYILNGNTTLNLTDLPVGVYLLRIKNETETLLQKIVKQ